MKIDSQYAKEHSEIRAFVELVEQTAVDGVLSIVDEQSPQFSKYWPNMLNVQRLPDTGDFMFRLFGSRLVDAFGRDMTGKMISDIDNEQVRNEIIARHTKVLDTRKPIYVGNNFHWSPRDYIKWVQVIFPMRRGDEINDTISCVFFE